MQGPEQGYPKGTQALHLAHSKQSDIDNGVVLGRSVRVGAGEHRGRCVGVRIGEEKGDVLRGLHTCIAARKASKFEMP